ncbi:MAG: hypothetical protein ACJ8DC_11490 [Gemmatimonadales bacterium]
MNVRLVDARTGEALWAELYDRELSQIFAVQAEIADHIAAVLAPGRPNRSSPAAPRSLEAYNLYLLGRFHWGKFTPDDEVKAREYYQQAVALDSTYAAAWAGLASVDLVLGGAPLAVTPARYAIPSAEHAAARALALDSAVGEAYHTLGLSLAWFDHDWANAEQVLRLGAEHAPNDPFAHGAYGWYLRLVGRFDEAWAQTARAVALDPLNWLFHQNAAYHLYLFRRYPQALDRCRRVNELLEDQCSGTEARVYLQQGQPLQAVKRLEHSLGSSDTRPGNPLLGYAYARAGRDRDARRELAGLQHRRDRGLASPADLALVHLGLGETHRALELLEEAAAERPSASMLLAFIGVDPLWDPLRGRPRFQAVLQRVGLAQRLVTSGETRGTSP